MLNNNLIYIEKRALDYPVTQTILKKLNPKNTVLIKHYKDVFCRQKQNINLQKDRQKIILAVKDKDFVYRGAPVCQDFDNENFYYSSCVMNCVCNCEYCYLKGMYPSSNLVIFVNIDDYFDWLKDKDYYICATYDTDLFPLEKHIGYVGKWLDFARENLNCKIEIRTKTKNLNIWNYDNSDNVIFAFSLSPQYIIDKYEHKTSNLAARLENIHVAQKNGFKTRICFDPIIYCDNWQNKYEELIKSAFEKIDASKVEDISVGSFRISQSYLKNMRKNDIRSSIVNFPFKNIDGYYQYEKTLQESMELFVVSEISKYFPQEKVFLWK